MSAGNTIKDRHTDMSERMKHTRDYKKKGFKGNSRGDFIQEGFTTLEEMFKKLPEHIGFNIEMSELNLISSEWSDPLMCGQNTPCSTNPRNRIWIPTPSS